MRTRGVHFVGSYPAPGVLEAMRTMLGGAGRVIDCVPDGETDVRARRVYEQLAALRDGHEAIATVLPGDGESSRLAVRGGHEAEFTAESLGGLSAFDYVRQATESRAVLDRLAEELDCPLTLQVGLPHALDLAMLAFSPPGEDWVSPPPYVDVFCKHLRGQIQGTLARIGADQVLFQIESQCVLLNHMAGAPTGPVDVIAETLPDVINRSTPQARFGVHLCLEPREGGPAVGDLRTTTPIVNAIAEIAEALERPEALEYVHFPLAAGASPPRLGALFYRPLARLRECLPAETRIIAGLVHEGQSLDEQLYVRDLVEDAIGEHVDIAAACGLGRRAPEVAEMLVARTMELAYHG